MGLISWIKGKFSRDKPQNNYKYNAFPFIFGRSIAGKNVDATAAMQNTAVMVCVKILAESIASLPLHLYKYTDTGKERAVKHPLYRLLHDEPNNDMTSFIFRELLMTHILLHGNGYAQILRDEGRRVKGLYPLMSNKMTVGRDDNTREITYSYQVLDKSNPNFDKNGTIILKAADVLHIPALGFDGVLGYSPLAMARNAIGLAIACEEYGSKFFSNGARPSGILKCPTILKDPTKLRESWEGAYGGSENAGKVAILEQGLEYQAISIPNNDAQFLESRKFQLEEIARIYRIPLHMINDLDHATFSNIENQSLEFVKYTLNPWIVRWEQALNKALLSSKEKGVYFFKFNVDGLMRGDYASRVNGYGTMIQNGVMSINDVRELEDMNKLPAEEGGDLHIINGSMQKLKEAGLAYKRGGAGES